MRETTKPPSYRLYKRTGQAVVTINGKDYYLGKFGSKASREAYDRLIGEWLMNGRCIPVNDGPLTVSEMIAGFWHYLERHYRKPDGTPTTEPENFRLALRPLRALYGHTPAAGFGPLALKTVRQRMIEAGGSRKYINKHIGRIKLAFKWAASEELVPAAVYHGLQTVAGLKRGRTDADETDPVRPVPEKYVDAIRPYVSRQVWAMVQLQRLTGMRSGEVIIMRGRDLDTAAPIWLYRPESHKTEHHGHERIVELGPRAQTVLKRFLKPDLDAYLFSPRDTVAEQKIEKRRKRKSKVQPSQQDRSKPNPKRAAGDRYSADSFRRAIQRACDADDAKVKADLIKAGEKPDDDRVTPRWHPHQLRHNYATRIRKEFGIEAARILLGHRSTAVTELYAEVDRGRVRDIVARVG